MRIGILLKELDVSGGTQRHALCLARELKRAGEDVTVFSLRTDFRRCYPPLMREVGPVDLGGSVPEPPPDRGAGRVIRRFLGTGPEFLWNRGIAESLPGDLDLLNVHELGVYPAAVYWKERTGKPIVWLMNDVPGEYSPRWSPKRPWRRIDRILTGKESEIRRKREVAERFDAIVALSHMEARRLEELTGILPKVNPPGIDIEAFPFLPREGPGSRPLRLFSNAILYPHRRLEDIVEALRILRDRGIPFTWEHSGIPDRDPAYSSAILGRVREAGLSEQAAFLGKIGEEELVGRLQGADIFLFPNAPQSWGMAPFEAMACGTPAVVSRGAGASEVLAHGGNALLVDPFSPRQIADAVEALRKDPSLWARLHREGRRFVEHNVRWDIHAEKMREEFLRIAAGSRPPA